MRIRLKSIITLASALFATVASAGSPLFYGYSPNDCSESQMSALGSGSNAFLEAVIRLDPSADPLAAKLKGKKITGVRFYLRSDYKQKSKGFSCIRIYDDGFESRLQSKTENFTKGWNEIYFDTPVEISDAPLYIGYQVYETQGEPFPIATFKNAKIDNVCYINAAKSGWIDYGKQGTLMIQAIIDADDAEYGPHAITAPMNEPLVVEPAKDFACNLYVHNQTSTPIGSLTYECRDDDGNLTGSFDLQLEKEIPGYGSSVVAATLTAPASEGAACGLNVSATAINGTSGLNCLPTRTELYVSTDVFYRIPVVEEFTGLSCPNCPFMFYYLDMALEQLESPHLYIAHHAGFVNDRLTQPCDEALLYLFGNGGTYNPAVMYDRRVMAGNLVPVEGAKSVASTEPYELRINEAQMYPALAKVLVDSEINSDGASCRVYGKISKAALGMKDNLFLSVYFLEDRIPLSSYPQQGLDPMPEGAPEDLLDRFCHRGVIRHCFTGNNGDKLEIDNNGNFDVSYSTAKIGNRWNLDNCEIVAIVHRVNSDDLSDNVILNGGATRYNEFAETGKTGVLQTLLSDENDTSVYVDSSNRIRTSDPAATLRIYSPDGSLHSNDGSLKEGIYVAVCTNGDKTTTRKIMIK